MTVPVLLALTDPDWEAGLVEALGNGSHPISVARRCLDLADLLAAAAGGLGRAALVAADLRRLDGDSLTRLAASGVAVIGVVGPDDEAAERRLRQWGVREVTPVGGSPGEVAAAVMAALAARDVDRGEPAGRDYADPGPALLLPNSDDAAGPADGQLSDEFDHGRVLAVWGPAGAPGRSTVAVGLAAELAVAGHATLLVDADVYAASVAQLLGLLDEAPGLAAACRLANSGRLDVPALAELALVVTPALRVLTGISRADRWPELRAGAVGAVLDLARRLARFTVVDLSFCFEQDEELSFDTAAPRRNAATLAVLDVADEVVAVAAADPVGLQRYVRGVSDLRELLPGTPIRPVVNRLRSGPVPGDPGAEVATVLARYAGLTDPHLVPDDRASADAALAAGRCVAEVAPGSSLRRALQRLAEAVAEGAGAPPRRRRHRPLGRWTRASLVGQRGR